MYDHGKSWYNSYDVYRQSHLGASCKLIHRSFHELYKLCENYLFVRYTKT
jgi:hypothetical protein